MNAGIVGSMGHVEQAGAGATDSLSRDVIRMEWSRMIGSPVGLRRPLVVLAGWRAPSIAVRRLAQRLVTLVGADPGESLAIGYPFRTDIEAIARSVVNRVVSRFPGEDGSGPREVDVVGVSMGGLVARFAAAPAMLRREGRRLRIRRLFTLASPHRGANIAGVLPVDAAVRQMRADSPLLRRLDEALECAEYEMVCYTRLRDAWVGAGNTAPPGYSRIVLPARVFGSHLTISQDLAITIDLARRLRDEQPLLAPVV
ncbi:MAG: hypothetical protein KF745_15405 [Phycisphaeraceae bacterium]|nr:hypothetical protein [Phycisphaeraceae bacterium]